MRTRCPLAQWACSVSSETPRFSSYRFKTLAYHASRVGAPPEKSVAVSAWVGHADGYEESCQELNAREMQDVSIFFATYGRSSQEFGSGFGLPQSHSFNPPQYMGVGRHGVRCRGIDRQITVECGAYDCAPGQSESKRHATEGAIKKAPESFRSLRSLLCEV